MSALEPLVKALNDDDPEARAAAAEALGRETDPRAIEILIGLLASDNDTRVRLKAAEALRQSKDGRAVEALVQLLAEAAASY